MPFPAHLTYCYNCRKQKVPDVLFTTIDLPVEAAVIGKGCLIQARYRSKCSPSKVLEIFERIPVAKIQYVIKSEILMLNC